MRRFCSFIVVATMLFLPAVLQARRAPADWITLLDGSTLHGWQQIGTANWAVVDGAVQATKGPGFLVTPRSYANFELQAEVCHWTTIDISAKGPHLVVALNRIKTVDVIHTQRTSGVIALQSTAGTVKFRRVRVRLLE